MRYLTPERFCQALESKERALKSEVRNALAETLEDTRATVVRNSSGPLSAKRLAQMGHPYGRSLGASLIRTVANVDPMLINLQKGAFVRGWKKAGPRLRAGALSGEVTNTDPKAKYMFGTKRMVPRRVDIATAREVYPRFKARVFTATKKALRA